MILPALLLLTGWTALVSGLSCNGNPSYCSLKFDQFTLVGSHGSGAGFNGPVRQCEGTLDRYCIYDNQNLSITQQLDLGVRFLNLDICILPNMCNETFLGNLSTSRLVSCKGGEGVTLSRFDYGGSLVDILQQTDDWLRRNRNEVIGLHFTRYIPSSDLSRVGSMIASLLESKWGATASMPASQLSTFYRTNGNTWPSLETAITDNQRVFVFFDSQISTQGPKPWLHEAPFVTENPLDVVDPTLNLECLHLNNPICSGSSETLILAAFNFGRCLIDAQLECNAILSIATDSCFESRITQNRTVNVIMVDFVSVGPVFEIAAEINRRNVLNYTGEFVTTMSPTSHDITEEITSGDPLAASTIVSEGTTAAASAIHAVNYFTFIVITFVFIFMSLFM